MDHELATRYIFGEHAEQTHGLAFLVATPTGTGWRVRSTLHGALNHDYVSYESFGEVMDWLDLDLHRAFVSTIREEVAELLANGAAGSLAADPTLASDAAAERVLRHLEHGW